MSTETAYIFGGHGSQEPNMGGFLINISEGARRVYDDISVKVGYSITDLISDRRSVIFPDRRTGRPADPEKAGVAIYATELAFTEALKEGEVPNPKFVMGHSQGQYAAMRYAGVGDFLNLVITRGKKMGEMPEFFKAQVGLVRGLDKNALNGLIDDVKTKVGIQPGQPAIVQSIRNTPDLGVVVIPDDPIQKDEFIKNVQEKGAEFESYPGSPPSHSPDLTWLARELRPHIPPLLDPIIPVLSDIRSQVLTKAGELKSAIESHVVTPFDWVLGLYEATEQGAKDFIIVGPAKVQTLIFQKSAPRKEGLSLHTTDSPQALLKVIQAFGNPKSDIAQALSASS